MKRLLIALGCLTVPVSLFPLPGLSAQKRAITIDDYLALKSVGNPQLSPDGKWVAYTVTEQSLKDNRGIARIWLADVASGPCASSRRVPDRIGSRAGRPTAAPSPSYPRARTARSCGCFRLPEARRAA